MSAMVVGVTELALRYVVDSVIDIWLQYVKLECVCLQCDCTTQGAPVTVTSQ
jgi:hypothetical protein